MKLTKPLFIIIAGLLVSLTGQLQAQVIPGVVSISGGPPSSPQNFGTTNWIGYTAGISNASDDDCETLHPSNTIVAWGSSYGTWVTSSNNPTYWTYVFPAAGWYTNVINFGATFNGTDCDGNNYSTNANTSVTNVIEVKPLLNIVVSGTTNTICAANGNNLAIVGQHVNLTAEMFGGTFSNYQWTVSGYAISNYNTFSGTLVTGFPLTNSSVSFYWADGGAQTVTFSAMCAGITCLTNVAISVTRPTLSMYQTDTPVWVAQGLALYRLQLDLGDTPAVNDMGFSVLANSPIAGCVETIQVINSYSINSSVVATNELDTLVPYNGSPSICADTDPAYPTGALLPFDDGPGAGYYYFTVTLNASFTDYIMYCPNIYGTQFAPLGGDTIFVPLGDVNWTINGGAYFSSPVSITISPASHTGPSGPDSSTTFPTWVGTYAPQHP